VKKKNCCHIFFFVVTNFTKIVNYFTFTVLKKKFGPAFKELKNFLPKNLSLTPQKYGFGLRDPIKTYFGSRGPGVTKASDPGSGSATRDWPE